MNIVEEIDVVCEIHYFIYDSRYLVDPDRAIVYEVCDTLKEARENAREYGNNNIIVKVKSLGNEILQESIIL